MTNANWMLESRIFTYLKNIAEFHSFVISIEIRFEKKIQINASITYRLIQ